MTECMMCGQPATKYIGMCDRHFEAFKARTEVVTKTGHRLLERIALAPAQNEPEDLHSLH